MRCIGISTCSPWQCMRCIGISTCSPWQCMCCMGISACSKGYNKCSYILVSFYVRMRGTTPPKIYPPTQNLLPYTPKMPPKRKSQRRETTESDRRLIWSYYNDGRSYGWISERLKINYSTVASLVQRMKKRPLESRWQDLPRPGAPWKLDVRAERALIRAIIKDTKAPLAVLGTPSKTGKQLHRNTVRKYLKEHNKHRRCPRKKPYMLAITKRKRVKWCKDWRGVDPMKICHSDESLYKIGFDSNSYYVT
jgi:transposase